MRSISYSQETQETRKNARMSGHKRTKGLMNARKCGHERTKDLMNARKSGDERANSLMNNENLDMNARKYGERTKV